MIQGSNSFNPFNDQGNYDLLMAVDPSDPERFLMGGVDLWSWSASEGWQARGSRFDSPNNPFYVHADNHDAVWHPTNPNIVYVVNDGGIFRSANNGFTWTPVNTNYNTLQLYSITASADGRFLGGSQDNGTIAVLPELNNGNYGAHSGNNLRSSDRRIRQSRWRWRICRCIEAGAEGALQGDAVWHHGPKRKRRGIL